MFCDCSPNVQLADSKNIVKNYTYTEVNDNILFMGSKELHFIQRLKITFYLREDTGKFMYVYRVMLNNHYNNFVAYTSQIWPVKKRHS